MFTLLKIPVASSLCAVLSLFAPISQAATVSYTFSGAVDAGLLSGETYIGSLAYSDVGLTGSGSESVFLSSFSFDFLSTTFGLGVADFQPTADFLDGAFLGVSYSYSGSEPTFTFVSALGTGLPDDVAYFAYDTLSGDAGFGSLNYVDEPSNLALFTLGLASLGWARRRVKNTAA